MRIGIDLGGTKTEAILMNDTGEILQRLRNPTPQADGYVAILDNIAALVAELEAHAGNPCRIGIGTPGSLSPHNGLLRNSNTVCMNGKPLLADLQALLKREILIANDANCFTLSETVDGAASGAGTVFGVIIGTGTGGGMVVNGKLIEGAQHIAGEWGHNPLGSEGRLCYCGRIDCVETYLSGPGLFKTWQQLGGKNLKNAKQVAMAAAEEHPVAQQAMQAYHAHFARALASMINIFDPDVIVLGGGLSNIDSLYTQGFDALTPHIFSDVIRTRMVKNQHGDSSGVRGAAWLHAV